jgi:L-aminopeptidase/D-esterase-like protein
VQAQKIAQMPHDGFARAIRPSHTMFDGDTIFCLATNRQDLPNTPGFFVSPKAHSLTEIGRSAADCMARAVIRGVLKATSLGNMIAFRDLDQNIRGTEITKVNNEIIADTNKRKREPLRTED